MGLEIVYLSPQALTPYEGNARKHNPEDIDQIKASIEADGFNDPIGIWGDKNLIVEGHGRQIAALELGLEKVPCIRLDHLTDTQRRDYAIRHNRTAELSGWDFGKLEEEIARLEIEGVDLSGLKFDFGEAEEEPGETYKENDFYTQKTDIPQYEPSGDTPEIDELCDSDKYEQLIAEIDASGLSQREKEFLKKAACRHLCFSYKRIADYYAHASREMQELMEHSALVIIDYGDAIKNGYAVLRKTVMELMDDE